MPERLERYINTLTFTFTYKQRRVSVVFQTVDVVLSALCAINTINNETAASTHCLHGISERRRYKFTLSAQWTETMGGLLRGQVTLSYYDAGD